MLVNFFIDPEAIPMEDGIASAFRDQVLKAMKSFGVTGGRADDWRNLTMRLPVAERKLWEAALERNPRIEVDVNLEDPCSRDAILDTGRRSLVALPSQAFSRWANAADVECEPGDELFTSRTPPPEAFVDVLLAPHILRAEAFAELQEWNESGIRAGANREDVWRERLLPVIRHCSNLHIIDAWFAESLARGASRSNPLRDSGPHWLASKLEQDLSQDPVGLHIYANAPADMPSDHVENLFTDLRRLAPNGVREISVHLMPMGLRNASRHDRHWRCVGRNQKWVSKFEYGTSVGLFDNQQALQDHQMRYFRLSRSATNYLREIEQELQSKSDSFAIT